MATAEQTKEAARRRKANQRARERGLPEPYPAQLVEEKEAISAREAKHREDLLWAQTQDDSGTFYKSECRSAIRLLAIFEGNNHVGVDDPDVIDKKTGKKKNNIPNPSFQAIRIRAIEHEGVRIDPNMKEYRNVFEVNGVIGFREWLDLRDKARKDLFWLGRLFKLDFYHDTHQIMCDMFVKKNFDGLFFPEFTRDDAHDAIRAQKKYRLDDKGNEVDTMVLFAPRSSFKSTIDGVDMVQWMINCPDIRVMILTSALDLSKQFLGEIKSYFHLPPMGEPSPFQLLFPEYILTGVDGTSEQPIRCPAQTFNSKEPHIWVTSLDASFVGKRCDIRKLDDVVDDKNSAHDELREKLKNKINSTSSLVEEWGFTDIIGTRYFTTDWYGWRMSGDSGNGEDVEPFISLSISAWTPKEEFKVKYESLLTTPKGMFQVTEDMVTLFFPSKLHFKELRKQLKAYKERGFKNQYLNIATDPEEIEEVGIHFEREVLRAHTYAKAAMPKSGEKIVTLDLAYTDNNGSDWSVLAACLRHIREDETEELVVEDADYGKWKASDLVFHTIMFLRKHDPSITLVEKANGWDLFWLSLRNQAERMGLERLLNSVRFVDVDNTKNAKTNRIKNLEILLADDRLHFVAGTWIDELYRQFERFTGETKKGRKDDFPDSISLATRRLPQGMFKTVVVDPEEEAVQQDEELKRLQKEEHYKQYFGHSAFAGTIKNPAPPTEHVATWRERATGVRKNAPVTITEEAAPVKQDPRMRIFGNKGPWRL